MVVRYEERFREMMAQAEVAPEAMLGLLDRLEAFVHPFCASLGAGERRRAAEYLTGLLSASGAQDRRGDRLPARPGAPADAEVHRPGRLGPSAPRWRSWPRRSGGRSASRTG